MEFIKESEQSVTIVLSPQDVESAIRQFICTCHPDYSRNWIIDPTNEVSESTFHLTKGDG